MSESINVLPVNDRREHVCSWDCWCEPAVETRPNGNRVVVHHALDGRERYEEGAWRTSTD